MIRSLAELNSANYLLCNFF